FTEEVKCFFEKELEGKKKYDRQGNAGKAFYCGYLLTFLMFHALAGNGEGGESLRNLRGRRELSLEAMEKTSKRVAGARSGEPVFLTGKNTELCSIPLTARHFFGREKELFELREMLAQGGRYLVSGIGGIGKTELMRQFIKCCVEERLVDYICTVQYENSLADSLIKAFPEVRGIDRENNFREALARIRVHAGAGILLVIDNMNGGQEEQGWEAFTELPATIFVTSRQQKLEGFETYQIEPVGKEARALVFRDNYQRSLSEEDRKALEEMTDREVWQHTLTLRLLGCVARTRSWTVSELLERLEKGEPHISLEAQDGYAGLQQVYRRTYAVSGLKKSMNRLLRVYAALPYESYGKSFAESYLQGFLEAGMDMGESLEKLWKGGWLEKRGNGYSMHPFIAECMLAKPLTEEDVAPFFERVCAVCANVRQGFAIETVREIFFNPSEENGVMGQEMQKALSLVYSVAQKLSGGLCEKFLQLILLAAESTYCLLGFDKEKLNYLTGLQQNCRNASAKTQAYWYIILCTYNYNDIEKLDKAYAKYAEGGLISKELKLAFASGLALRNLNSGNTERAKELAQYIWEYAQDSDSKMGACYIMAESLEQTGDLEGCLLWADRGEEIGKSINNKNTWNRHQIMFLQCVLNTGCGNFEKVKRILEEEQEILKNEKSYFFKFQLLYYGGSYKMYSGEEGYGVPQLEEACKVAKIVLSAAEGAYYANVLADLAMAYNKAGCREEACEQYKKVLDIYDRVEGHAFERHRILNNMGVMYLDWEKPEEALSCLEEAYQIGVEMGGLAAAEPANNLSKAYRQLGDREKELGYLQEAAPVLEQFYGSAHPKVVDAKKRMKEENTNESIGV
ncbi:MAG: ATP-binding protein, partial [Lachnospiraceae bacterium]|nr:ATP-binding protein [Lachnospiraceae bacterium]